MKNVFLLIMLIIITNCKSQIYPLRTYNLDEFPKDSYVKDTNNELPAFEGTWKGSWNNKTIFITFKKIKYYKSFLDYRAYYADILVGKFKVLDNNGNILFDNTNISDNNAKIKGGNFRKTDDKYSLIYNDPDLCHMTGSGRINFTDSTKTKLEWRYSQNNDWVENECFYHGLPYSQRPEPLPSNIILTKQ